MIPAEHAEQYFGLMEDLERLLGRPVDLVEPGPIRNPYFLQSLEETQVLLYAAAGRYGNTFSIFQKPVILSRNSPGE